MLTDESIPPRKETCIAPVPANVQSVEVKIINSESCMLTWQPADTGPLPLLGYYIEQLRLDGFGWARVNNIVTEKSIYLVNGLVPARRYKFRVITVDSRGGLNVGTESNIVQPLERPHPPSVPSVYDVTQHSCCLEWEPPAWDGGTPVTNYEVEMQTNYSSTWKSVCKVDAATYAKRIDGLVADTHYAFQIVALNKIGKSFPSQVSDTVKATGKDVTNDAYLASLSDAELESKGLQCVSLSFNRGVNRIISTIELIHSQNHFITYWAEQRLVAKLVTLASAAYTNIQNAGMQLESLNKELNKRLGVLIAEQEKRKSDLKQKEIEISQCNKEIKAMEKQLLDLRLEKLKAESDMLRAEETIKHAEEQLRRQKKKKKKAGVFGIAISICAGAIFGPVTGLVVGGLTLAGCNTFDDVIRRAREMRDIAQQNRDCLKQRLEDKKNDISNAQSELANLKAERDVINTEIKTLKNKINRITERIAKAVDVSSNIKQCNHFVSITESRSELLHDQTRFLYQPATLLRPLQELTSHLTLPGADRLGNLLSRNKIEMMSLKVKMLAEADRKWKPMELLSHEKDLQVSVGSKTTKAMIEKIAAIDEVTDGISTYKSALEDAAMILSHVVGWEQLLSPAPMTLAFLGQLLLLTVKSDVPLHGNTESGSLELLKQPDSLRASIVQIVNDGWKAFNTAHVNMDRIRIDLQTLPIHLKNTVDIISTGSDAEVANFLYLPLSTIKLTSENCLQNARQTETSILMVVKTIGELQEICALTKGRGEAVLSKIKTSLKVARDEVATVEEEKQLLEARKTKLREAFLEAEQQFDNAITSLPDGWNLFGMAVVDAVVSTVTATVNVLIKPLKKSERKRKTGPTNPPPNLGKDDTKVLLVYAQAVIYSKTIASLVSYIQGSGLGKINVSEIVYCKSQIKFTIDKVKKICDCRAKTQLESLCGEGLKVCQQLEKHLSALVLDEQKIRSLVDQTLRLQKNLLAFVDKIKVLVDSAEESKAPNRRSWHVPDYCDKGMVRYELDNAKSKVEQTCKQLEYAQIRYDEVAKNIEETNTRLRILLSVITRMDMEGLSIVEIIELLGKGLQLLADLRQPWGNLVQFFGALSNLVDTSLTVTLNMMSETSTAGNSSKVGGYNISHFRRDMIYHQAVLAAEIANFVSMIADNYTKVSKIYMMPTIKGLLGLTKLNPETQREGLREQSQKLTTSCESAHQNIERLMKENKEEFHAQLKSRIARLRDLETQKLAEIENTIEQLSDKAERDTEALNPEGFV